MNSRGTENSGCVRKTIPSVMKRQRNRPTGYVVKHFEELSDRQKRRRLQQARMELEKSRINNSFDLNKSVNNNSNTSDDHANYNNAMELLSVNYMNNSVGESSSGVIKDEGGAINTDGYDDLSDPLNFVAVEQYEEPTPKTLELIILKEIRSIRGVMECMKRKIDKIDAEVTNISKRFEDIEDRFEKKSPRNLSPKSLGLPLKDIHEFNAFNEDEQKITDLRDYLTENIGGSNLQKDLRDFLNVVASDEFFYDNVVWCQLRNDSSKITLFDTAFSTKAFYGALKMSRTYKNITRAEYESAAQNAVKNAYQRHYMVLHPNKSTSEKKRNIVQGQELSTSNEVAQSS